tara:strand:- start:830 stop:3556 length:2727 start_codon:yes stop_codon:yes gene_type:complete
MTKKMDVDKIKAGVDIADIIGRYITIKKSGAEYTGCCPFHDEKSPSLSVVPNKGMYYCFGCGANGDVIDFVMEHTGCKFVEACESLGGKLEGEFTPIKKRATPERVDYYAEYDPVPTKNRINNGDSITIINPKRDGKLWENAKPSMVFPYYTAMGDIHGYVLRLEIGGSKITPMVRWCNGPKGEGWHNYPLEEPRLAYGLMDVLKDKDRQILIPEGEKATDAAFNAVNGKVACASWSGGTNGINKTDWGFVKGRKIILWPDNDVPGMKAMCGQYNVEGKEDVDGLAIIAYNHGAESVHVIHPPEDLPKGWDCADREWTEKEIFDFCKMYKQEYPKPLPRAPEVPQHHNEAPQYDGAHDAEYELEEQDDGHYAHDMPTQDYDHAEMPFRILGHYHNSRYYLPTSTQQIIALEPSQHTKNNLLSLAPMDFWISGSMDIATKSGLDTAVNMLLQLSSQKGLFNAERLRGRGAWLDSGRAMVHMGQTVYIDGKPATPESIDSHYIYQQDIDLGIKLTQPLGNQQANELVKISKKLSWENPLSAMFLVGWCVIAPLTGMLHWRPHVWVTGPSGAGKSTVLKSIISVMLGDTALVVEGKTTEAGIRQQLGLDARPVIFDEAEAEDKASIQRLKSILDFARVCSSGGNIVKGSANGDSIKFSARAAFCFSSINTSIKHFADESRISQLILKRDLKNPPEFYTNLEEHIMNTITPDYASAMFSRSVQNMQALQTNTKVFTEAAHLHFRSRRVADQIGVLLAGAYLCYSTNVITRDAAMAWIKDHDWNDHTVINSKSDFDRLLSRLMTHKIRVSAHDGPIELSIGEAIVVCSGDRKTFNQDDIESELKRIGIKLEGDKFLIANNSDPLTAILRDTPWESSWSRTLTEIDSSEKRNTMYFSPGIKCRAVSLPVEIISS